MTTEHPGGGLIGKAVRRVEDPKLITGKGCYVDDIQLPGSGQMIASEGSTETLRQHSPAARQYYDPGKSH